MRVLFVTTNWPSEGSPIDGIFVREHALAAAETCDVAVIHLSREAGGSGLYEISPLEEPLPSLSVRYRRFGRPLSYAAFALGAWAALRRLRTEGFEPDVIHANSFLSAAVALGPARVLKKPLAYTEHWTIFTPENPGRLSPAMRRLARFALSRADIVLPVSKDLERALVALAPEARTRVVPNVVAEVFSPAPSEDGQRTRLLSVGLLDTPRKGVDILLEALALLPERGHLHLDIVGEGKLRPQYEALTERLGLADSVAFHDLEAKQVLAERMRSAHLFVLASRYENNPCVVLEAMASGLPVVATRVGGVPELVTPESGRLAEPLEPSSFAAALEDALGNDFDRAAIAARARERFGRPAIARELAAVYDELVG
jgi:glycosyltransferase involved in cell wall biosynthesis